MKIMILNGPNLNLLGKREPAIYGGQGLAEIEAAISALAAELGMETCFFQSNIEGEIVDALQRAGNGEADGVILNAGAYTHTSVAVRDAIRGIGLPVVEVHLSNPAAREPFRHKSLLAGACCGAIAGFGADSYTLALLWFARESGLLGKGEGKRARPERTPGVAARILGAFGKGRRGGAGRRAAASDTTKGAAARIGAFLGYFLYFWRRPPVALGRRGAA